MDKEVLELLKRLESKIDDNTIDIKEMKADIKSFKHQFTDFEAKNTNNHCKIVKYIWVS